MSEGTPKNDTKTTSKDTFKSGEGNASTQETEEQLFFDFDEYPRRKRATEEVVSK